MPKRQPIEHFIHGRDAWHDEAFGFIYGWRLKAITLLLMGVAAALPFFVQVLMPVWALVDILVLLLLFGLYYLKYRSKRSLEMKFQLHMIAHSVRDRFMRLQNNSESPDIEEISNSLCSLVKEYFSVLTNSDRIGVAIRHATKIDGKTAYVTKGRAGLNPNRSETSEPLFEDEGIAKIFVRADARKGVYLISDIVKAAKVNAFTLKANDKNYSGDIKSMIFSPINGWDGARKGVLGILYITTSEQGLFSEKFTDSVGFIADSLANVYSALVETQLTGDENEPYKFRRS